MIIFSPALAGGFIQMDHPTNGWMFFDFELPDDHYCDAVSGEGGFNGRPSQSSHVFAPPFIHRYVSTPSYTSTISSLPLIRHVLAPFPPGSCENTFHLRLGGFSKPVSRCVLPLHINSDDSPFVHNLLVARLTDLVELPLMLMARPAGAFVKSVFPFSLR